MNGNQWVHSALLGTFMVALAGLSGCAHAPHARGSVALKHSAQEADVCLGKNEVKPGDTVALFKSECKPRRINSKEGGDTASCTKVKIGEGRVLQNLGDHYSTIQVDSGVSFAEGTIVEKM